MKTEKIIAISLISATTLVIAPWLFVYWGHLSPYPEHWGQFGDYLGGTLSALISGLALIALLRTISQQQKQIDLITNKANKDDLLTALDKLENDLKYSLNLYPLKIQHNDVTTEVTGYSVLFNRTFLDFKDVVIGPAALLEETEKNDGISKHNWRLLSFEMFSSAADTLNKIRYYIAALDALDKSNTISNYYHRKYVMAYKRLVMCGFPLEPWEAKD